MHLYLLFSRLGFTVMVLSRKYVIIFFILFYYLLFIRDDVFYLFTIIFFTKRVNRNTYNDQKYVAYYFIFIINRYIIFKYS